MGDRVIDGYQAAAGSLIAPYEALSCDEIYQHVRDLMPVAPVRVLDIGAGTGRDAAWLAGQGHAVTAVEPVPRFLAAARGLHADHGIVWIDDRLPDLTAMRQRNERFDLLLMGGVWQHLSPSQRETAWPVLADLMAPGATMILSLRHGPGAPGRPVFPARDVDVLRAARDLGLRMLRRQRAGSIQAGNRAAGVDWTWFVLRAPGGGTP